MCLIINLQEIGDGEHLALNNVIPDQPGQRYVPGEQWVICTNHAPDLFIW